MKIGPIIPTTIFTAILITTACSDDNDDCVDGSGNVVTEERELAEFDGIEIRGAIDVELRAAATAPIMITGEDNILAAIDSRVINKVLIFDNEGCLRHSEQVRADIRMPQLRAYTIAGSGNLNGNGLFEQDSTSLTINGSGDLQLELQVRELATTIRGSGDVALSGSAIHHAIVVEGSGDIDCLAMPTESIDVTIAGSGTCLLDVSGRLNVTIAGSGDVVYRGDPEITSSILGTGQVRRLE